MEVRQFYVQPPFRGKFIYKQNCRNKLHFFILHVFRNQTGDKTVSTVSVVYEGKKEIGSNSKNGEGTYNYIGYQLDDKSAIYAQSQEDFDKHQNGQRSVILRNLHGDKNWIGTVMIVFHQYVLIGIGCIIEWHIKVY